MRHASFSHSCRNPNSEGAFERVGAVARSANIRIVYIGEDGGDGGLAAGEGSEANGENGSDGGYVVGKGSKANGGGIAAFGGQTGPDCEIAVKDSCFNQPTGMFNPF
jgi:hypothetical protein